MSVLTTAPKSNLLSIWFYTKNALSSSRNPYPSHGRSSEIPRGKGVLKVKILEAKYDAKLEFPKGMGGAK